MPERQPESIENKHQRQAQFEQILDRLRVTPQHFLDLTHSIGREAVSTVDEAQPIFIQPSKILWTLTYLYRINIDKFDQSLRNAMDALGVGYCYMTQIACLDRVRTSATPNDHKRQS
jgi:hypothetical protein